MKFATKAIHCGNKPDPITGAIIPPIYMTSTYVQAFPGETQGYEYTRAQNPNFTNLEIQLASLENAENATVFSSGLGALTALATTLSYGDKVVAIESLYGGTQRLFRQLLSKFGILFETYNATTLEGKKKLEDALTSRPKWLLLESPANPLLEVYDLEAYAKLGKQHGVTTIVDNTFATPYFQNPLKWGIDIVWHSTTKYLGGHSDVIGGVIMSNSSTLKESLEFARKSIGVNPSPFDTWLTSRGVKTLAVRMEKHQENALKVATFLEQHSKVKKVYYPGLKSHLNHEIAKKQMTGFSGMVSAEFNLSIESTKKLISSFKLFALAESLGGVESLVDHPATMTHASIHPNERAKIGLSDGLVRFSVGIEDSEDLIQDLQNSLLVSFS